MAPHAKGSTITDPIVLERLQKAREKALETRRAKAQEKKDMKLADELESRKKVSEARDKIKKTLNIDDEQPKEDPPKYEDVVEETPPPNLKKSPTKQDLKEEDEPQVEYIKVPKKTKPKPKKKTIVYVEEDSSSDESEVEYVKRPKRKEPKQPKRPVSPHEKYDYERQTPQDNMLDRLYKQYYGGR
jgi:hypothetical protein